MSDSRPLLPPPGSPWTNRPGLCQAGSVADSPPWRLQPQRRLHGACARGGERLPVLHPERRLCSSDCVTLERSQFLF